MGTPGVQQLPQAACSLFSALSPSVRFGCPIRPGRRPICSTFRPLPQEVSQGYLRCIIGRYMNGSAAMNLTDAAQLILALTGLVGALAGVFGVWIALKARANPYQEKLFERRLSAYAELHAAVVDAYFFSQALIPHTEKPFQMPHANHLEQCRSAIDDLRRIMVKHDFFFSFALSEGAHDVLQAGLDVLNLQTAPIPDAEMRLRYTDLDRQLDTGLISVRVAAQKDLGLEELTTRTHLLISKGH